MHWLLGLGALLGVGIGLLGLFSEHVAYFSPIKIKMCWCIFILGLLGVGYLRSCLFMWSNLLDLNFD